MGLPRFSGPAAPRRGVTPSTSITGFGKDEIVLVRVAIDRRSARRIAIERHLSGGSRGGDGRETGAFAEEPRGDGGEAHRVHARTGVEVGRVGRLEERQTAVVGQIERPAVSLSAVRAVMLDRC